ncbi:hypothetical protein O181_018940 [Austropuccinia psidii MF-1]|uniref:Carboxylic ester hydrolase n=1 Tax=Austropuccinia psidii MF-1 TaxID=1389203 RepID=A0A9Q3C9M1_9BASI|nr:hypothetical protein [Austropuccinia psidii MF-1]
MLKPKPCDVAMADRGNWLPPYKSYASRYITARACLLFRIINQTSDLLVFKGNGAHTVQYCTQPEPTAALLPPASKHKLQLTMLGIFRGTLALSSIFCIILSLKIAELFRLRLTVRLNYGSFIGKIERKDRLERFYGIPFAEPPIGQLRFANPIKPTKQYWKRDCTKHTPACPQQTFGGNTSIAPYQGWLNGKSLNPLGHIRAFGPGQEDCLTLDITRPKGTTSSSRLPVMFFIFPGGFNYGTSWQLSPRSLVKKSMSMGLPVIHVTANHRLNAFGFLAGKEVYEAGVSNLGLKDQRLTLEWIKTYISEFGGDPNKVTIYGESSGAISVSHQILAYQGQHNNLFRAAICQSGTALPVEKISDGAGQKIFDYIAQNAGGCGNSTDKLNCLRKAPFKEILNAVGHFPGTFSFGAFPPSFAPVVDGDFVSETIQHALKAGRFAKVPVITGDTLDEGTVLALGTLPLRNEEELRNFLSDKLLQPAPHMENILKLWPSNPEAGSPFASGSEYALTPVYKQYSAILGDIGFHGLRRNFLRHTSKSIPTWSYLDQAWKDLPIIGSFHASELPALFGFIPGIRKEEYQTRWIAFANNLDPNYPGLHQWTTYDKGNLNLVIENNGSKAMEPDDFRSEAIDYYLNNIDDMTLKYP